MAVRHLIPALAAVALLFVSGPASAGGAPRSPTERLRLLAACTGRLTAEVQFAWLVAPGTADALQSGRDRFDALLLSRMAEALAGGMPEGQAMTWRVSEWAVQRDLLEAGLFATDPGLAARAKRRAEDRRAECVSLLDERGA